MGIREKVKALDRSAKKVLPRLKLLEGEIMFDEEAQAARVGLGDFNSNQPELKWLVREMLDIDNGVGQYLPGLRSTARGKALFELSALFLYSPAEFLDEIASVVRAIREHPDPESLPDPLEIGEQLSEYLKTKPLRRFAAASMLSQNGLKWPQQLKAELRKGLDSILERRCVNDR